MIAPYCQISPVLFTGAYDGHPPLLGDYAFSIIRMTAFVIELKTVKLLTIFIQDMFFMYVKKAEFGLNYHFLAHLAHSSEKLDLFLWHFRDIL